MYIPKPNQETDEATLQQFIRENALCTLVTQTAHGLVASHIPMVLHSDNGGSLVLRGHVARANTQWKDHLGLKEALGIFTGPEHYISASWYPQKAVHGREVPTWNYVAVHVYGSLHPIEDPAWLLEHLRSLTDQHEGIAETPWKVSDAPAEFIAKLSGGIVGLELRVSRIEGKWKASQNRNDQDAAAVAQGLRSLRTAEADRMSELVTSRRPR